MPYLILFVKRCRKTTECGCRWLVGMELYRSSAPYACVRKNIPMPQKKARVERCRKNLLVHFPNFLFSSVLLLAIQCSCCTGPSLYTQLHLIHPIRPTSTTVLDRLLNQHDGVKYFMQHANHRSPGPNRGRQKHIDQHDAEPGIGGR